MVATATQASVKPLGLEKWVARLGAMDLPAFAGVVNELNSLSNEEGVSANKLASVISKDPGLTSQVLKISNSVHYRPVSDQEIGSLDRAVVQLGFSGIRAICISLMVIDSIVGDQPRNQLIETMAKSFHSAVQAKNLLDGLSHNEQEDCFVSGLLLRLGEIAFLGKGGKYAQEYQRLIIEEEMEEDEAAQLVLGTDFRSLSLGLAKKWGLGDSLELALAKKNLKDPKIEAIVLSEEISDTAVNGWDSPEFGEILAQLAKLTGKSITEIKGRVVESAREAAEVVVTYGMAEAAKVIPDSDHLVEKIQQKAKEPEADAKLQLDILRKLGSDLVETMDMNAIFRMSLEGIHKGIGLERVVLMLLNPRTKKLEPKYLVGETAEKWRGLDFSYIPAGDNLFTKVLHSRELIVGKSKTETQYRHLLTLDALKALSKGSFIVAPVFAGNRDIGVFIVDRGDTGLNVKKKQLESFTYFHQETNKALSKLANRLANKTAV